MRLVTICLGAFLLPSIGLLDGREVTSQWRYAERLRSAHPAFTVNAGMLYAEDDRILTEESARGV